MNTNTPTENQNHFLNMSSPESWIERFAPLIAKNGQVLDLACGGGRHSDLLLKQNHYVTAIDLRTQTITERLTGRDNLSIITADMEDGCDIFADAGVLAGRQFDGIVVVNYLYRPLFPGLLAALKPNGVFLYETFARENEKYARPRNPDHLLEAGELLERVAGHLQIIAYEHGMVNACGGIGVKQRIAAINSLEPCKLEDLYKVD